LPTGKSGLLSGGNTLELKKAPGKLKSLTITPELYDLEKARGSTDVSQIEPLVPEPAGIPVSEPGA
jgi:hypothetical protein